MKRPIAAFALLAACSGASVDATTTSTASMPSSPTTSLITTTTVTTSTVASSGETAWTAADAERWVVDYLAALAAGAYDQAGWAAWNNGIAVPDGDQLPADFLGGACADGACAGPYTVEALGPGLVDPVTAQASSKVLVTHEPSGQRATVVLNTFEGQLIIIDPPPLVPSVSVPTLVEELFGADIPDRVVVRRLDAFEIWTDGSVEWVTNWWADDAHEVEGGWAAVWHPAGSRLVSVSDPAVTFETECPNLVSRVGVVLVLEQCWSDSWRLFDPATGEEQPTPVDAGTRGDGEYVTFTERASTVVVANGDAEGNLTGATTLSGIDLLGDSYAGFAALSVDGAHYAYVDHADPAALNHFWSPVLVVVDTASGVEVGRWVLDDVIACVEFSRDWVVTCGVTPDPMDSIQVALTAINITTGEVRRVETPSRVFLPIAPSG